MVNNNIKNIYTTISDGRTYIAADTQYLGSVDSYNNFFTQFFARLFGSAVDVNFDGKIRCLDKTGYKNLLRSLNQSDTFCPTIFRNVTKYATLPQNHLKMRDIISKNDRKVLYNKLAEAISKGDTSKALLMIGKGAALDSSYFDRSLFSINPSFYSDTEGLSPERRYSFTVFRAPPILQAAKKANKFVVDFLKEAGADLNATGKSYTFNREIIDVHRNLDWTMEPRFVPHHHHYGHGRHRVDHRLEYRPQLIERTTVRTQDSRTNEKDYKLDNDYNLISA